MAYESDDTIWMYLEILKSEKPSEPDTPELEDLSRQIQAEVDKIHAMGGSLDIPFE